MNDVAFVAALSSSNQKILSLWMLFIWVLEAHFRMLCEIKEIISSLHFIFHLNSFFYVIKMTFSKYSVLFILMVASDIHFKWSNMLIHWYFRIKHDYAHQALFFHSFQWHVSPTRKWKIKFNIFLGISTDVINGDSFLRKKKKNQNIVIFMRWYLLIGEVSLDKPKRGKNNSKSKSH